MGINQISSSSSFNFPEKSKIRQGSSSEVPQKNEAAINKKVSKEQVEEVITEMKKFLPKFTSLDYEMHDELNEYYVKIVNDSTKEVIREIPVKNLLDKFAEMQEFLGVLFDRKI